MHSGHDELTIYSVCAGGKFNWKGFLVLSPAFFLFLPERGGYAASVIFIKLRETDAFPGVWCFLLYAFFHV